MHYYKFNVPSWNSATSHLTPEEEGVYIRLINFYYDTEKPIPLDFKPVLRKLRLSKHEDLAANILDEFFLKTKKGYTKEKCDNLIAEYQSMVDKNKKNGSKGGRPRKGADLKETQTKPSGLNLGTQTEPKQNPNQEPITINQEPITNLKEGGEKSPAPKPKVTPFQKPNIGEITAHFYDKGFPQPANEAEKFFHFYESKGWMVGKSKMKSWKSAVNGWIARNKDQPRLNGAGYKTAQQQAAEMANFTRKLDSPSDLDW